MKSFRNQTIEHSKNALWILIATLLSINVPAQIVYTDITDTILVFPQEVPGLQDETNYFYFDLNNDGTDDFYFQAHFWEEWLSPSAPDFPNYVLSLKSVDNQGIPQKLPEPCAFVYDSYDTIQSSYWSDYGDMYVDIFLAYLNCDLPYQDRYIGLRLSLDSDYFYGWIRLDASTDTLLFKDYAYNSSSNEIILAGQTETVGIPRIENNNEIQVYYDGQNIRLKTNHNNFESFSVFTVDGNKVSEGKISSPATIEFTIPKPGIYLVLLEASNNFVVKKVFIQ